MRVYLAGPLGFSEVGRGFHETVIKPRIEALGHEALDPWTLTDPADIDAVAGLPYGPEKRDRWRALNTRIGRANAEAIDRCDAVFAVLDGPDVDSGTAAEIGYACARGKAILGYRGDLRVSADNEGAMVNLQVEYFIEASGGRIITTISELEGALGRLSSAKPEGGASVA